MPVLSTRPGRMEEMNFFTDAKQEKFQPTTPGLRTKDQESDGMKGEALYGVLGLASGLGAEQDGEEGKSRPSAHTPNGLRDRSGSCSRVVWRRT